MITKSLKFFLVMLILFSCKETKKEINPEKPTKVEVVNKSKDSAITSQKDTVVVAKSDYLFKILLPISYRIIDNNDPTKSLTKDWFELLEKDGNYYIEKATYTISKGYDECVGTDTKSIETKNHTILFLDYKKMTTGKVDNLLISKKYIWPKEKINFDFKNTKCTFRAEGNIKSTENRTNDKEETEIWHKVENYKLYVKTSNKNEQLIISEVNFNDTFVSLIFVGDIDRDGKLDFIFEANRNYEEKRVILFLSSESENNESIKKVSEISIQFDC